MLNRRRRLSAESSASHFQLPAAIEEIQCPTFSAFAHRAGPRREMTGEVSPSLLLRLLLDQPPLYRPQGPAVFRGLRAPGFGLRRLRHESFHLACFGSGQPGAHQEAVLNLSLEGDYSAEFLETLAHCGQAKPGLCSP